MNDSVETLNKRYRTTLCVMAAWKKPELEDEEFLKQILKKSPHTELKEVV